MLVMLVDINGGVRAIVMRRETTSKEGRKGYKSYSQTPGLV
jgi:hypothetical protein